MAELRALAGELNLVGGSGERGSERCQWGCSPGSRRGAMPGFGGFGGVRKSVQQRATALNGVSVLGFSRNKRRSA